MTLARLFRTGELTSVWVPDAVHEAVRDLVRAREVASRDLRKKRQQLLSFLLRHGRIFTGPQALEPGPSALARDQKFQHPAQQIVFQDADAASGSTVMISRVAASNAPRRIRQVHNANAPFDLDKSSFEVHACLKSMS